MRVLGRRVAGDILGTGNWLIAVKIALDHGAWVALARRTFRVE